MSNIRYNSVRRVLFLVLAFSFAVQSNAMLNRKPLFQQRIPNPVQTIVDQINAPVSDPETFNTAIQQIINDRIAQYKSQDPKTWPLYLRQNPNAQAKDLANYYLLDKNSSDYDDKISHLVKKMIENLTRQDLLVKMEKFNTDKKVLLNEGIDFIKNNELCGVLWGHHPLFVVSKKHLYDDHDFKNLFEYINILVHHEFTHVEQQANINTLNAMGTRMTTEEDDPAFRTFVSSQGSMLASAMTDFLDRYAEDEHGNPYLEEKITKPFFTEKDEKFLDEAEACISEIQWTNNPHECRILLTSSSFFRPSFNYPSLTTLLGVLHKYHPSMLDEDDQVEKENSAKKTLYLFQ